MNDIRALLFALLLALTAACSTEQAGAPPLQGASIGGPFTLTGQNGRPVSDRDFAGRYRLVYFGFTHCPDVCPTDLQQIGQAMRQLEKSDPGLAQKVQPIFITVDPERDTPSVMKDYAAAFHPRLIGLTGTPQQIADVTKSFAIFSAKEGTGPDYNVNHTRIAYLLGPQGEPIAILPHDEGAAAIAAEIKRWAT